MTNPPARPVSLVLDFDGTIALEDVGDAICDRFAPPAWREWDERWVRGEVSLPEAQRVIWPMVRASAEDLSRFLREEVHIRPGLDELLAAARGRGAEFAIASQGFDLYIRGVLGGRLDGIALFANAARHEGAGISVEFPHAEVACRRDAVCKGRVVEGRKAAGRRVIFAGDGQSDRCAVGAADRVFAVRGRPLERFCREAGAPHTAFEDLRELIAALDG